MTTQKPRRPMSLAVLVGVVVFVAMMVGVGGYQAVAGHVVGAFMLGVDPEPLAAGSSDPAPGSALSMCAQSVDDGPSSFITVHASSWRHSGGSQSSHSPAGLASVCN